MKFVELSEIEKEKLCLIESKKEEIVKILNDMAIFEFTMNYNLSEYRRIIDVKRIEETENYKSFKKELEDILKPILDSTEFTYRIMNFGVLTISHPINSTEIFEGCSQEVLNLRHNTALPYAYIMGKSVGKKDAVAWIKENVL